MRNFLHYISLKTVCWVIPCIYTLLITSFVSVSRYRNRYANPNEYAGTAALLPAATVADAANATGVTFRGIHFTNYLRKSSYMFRFNSRQLIATGNKQISISIALNSVLGSHRQFDAVILGVKHSYV